MPFFVRKGHPGFTLIEVIAVLLLLGILAAVAIPRMIDHSDEVRVTVDKLKVHLRHAQLRAMNAESDWGIRSSGKSYFLFRDGNVSNKVSFLGEEELTVPIPSGVSCSTFTLSFDGWGAPYNGASPETGSKVSGSGFSISVGGESITILPDTGFIP